MNLKIREIEHLSFQLQNITRRLIFHKFIFIFFVILIYNSTFAQASNDSLLFEAVKKNDIEAVKNFIAGGANVNATDKNSATILMWATYKGDITL